MLIVTSIASWAADPYFEVVSGSFASGNVTVKFTFPEATTVSVTGSIYLDHNDKPSDVYVTARGSAVSTEGNTATATFTYTPWAGISESGYSFWSGGITAEGYTQYTNIHAKPVPPYAEVLSGSLTSGTLAVKVTIPNISTIAPDLGSSYAISLWNNDVKLDAKTSSVAVSVTGNTLSTTFNFTAQTDDDLSAALIKVDKWALKLDGAWNEAMEISFSSSTPSPSGCEHTNCTLHPAVEPTESTPGNIAYVQCNDCEKYFAATDTEHTTPLEWSAIQLTYCAHEHLGADDICADCNRVLPHAPRTMTWTVNGITATYNKAARSLTFSGEGTMPEVDLLAFAEDQQIAKLVETYPWYGVLNPRFEAYYSSSRLVVDAVATLTIENGVLFANECYYGVQFITAGVVYDHTDNGRSANNYDVVVVDNQTAKDAYGFHAYTQADLATMGVTSFPSEVFWSMGDHYHLARYTKQPECSNYSSYNSYCPVCGSYTDGISLTEGKHDYNYAGVCYNCGAKDPLTCTHTNVNSYAAVASTDTYHGHIAFKKCSDCGQYFAADDASCTIAFDFETQVLLPLAAPGCVHVMNTMTAECTGLYSTYYSCEVCGLLFADAAGETEISEADVMHSFNGVNVECAHNCGKHDPVLCYHETETYHDTVAPTCTEDGMNAHWECDNCGALFVDYNHAPTTSEALKIYSEGHNLNDYDVCIVCGFESAFARYCSHSYVKILGDSRTTCTQSEGYNIYYRCNNCKRYLEESVSNMGEYTSVLKSEMQITPGTLLHGGHITKRDAVPEACTQAAPNIKHWYCSVCKGKYFSYATEDECVAENQISEDYFNSKTSAPKGHNFENGSHVCSRCGFDAVYRKVTVDSQIKPGANYILVSKIGDQYYAMGKPGKDSDQKYKGSLGYDAVPVTMESDGTISVTSNAVMPLYTIGQIEEPFDNNGYTRDGIRSRVPHIAFYNPVYGMVSYGPDYSLETKNRDIVLDWTSSWAFNETEAMNMHIYNGESKFYGDKNTLYGIMAGDSYGARAIEPGVLLYHMVDWGGSVFMNRYHGMYLGKNNGQNPRFHVPGFTSFGFTSENTNFEYENIYPVYLYLLDTKKFINAESTTAANVSGPVIKDDVMSIFTKAKASYDNATNLLNLYKQNDQYGYFDGYEVDMNSYRFTTIDLSKARITDGDLTYQDIMAMKDNEFSAPNVIIVLPETSGASSAKARKASSDGNSLASIPNVIIDGACQTLELEDKQTMNVPVDFTAGNVSYSRTNVSSAWGTLCLPYAISSDENVQLYKLTEVDNSNADGTMTFKPIEEAEAGQPIVFKKLDADATKLSFAKENAELTIAGFNGESTEVAKWELLGTYEQAKIISDKDFGRYYIAKDKFWNAKNEATVPAFRAWFEYDKNSASQAAPRSSYMIFIEDDDANVTNVLTPNKDGELEECTEIYDLSGKKLTAPIKGQINIINGKKIFVK